MKRKSENVERVNLSPFPLHFLLIFSFSLHFLSTSSSFSHSLSPFPLHFLFIFSFFLHFLAARLPRFVQQQQFLHECHYKMKCCIWTLTFFVGGGTLHQRICCLFGRWLNRQHVFLKMLSRAANVFVHQCRTLPQFSVFMFNNSVLHFFHLLNRMLFHPWTYCVRVVRIPGY